jgi:radical SAM enzyme (TIGR01210 family)
MMRVAPSPYPAAPPGRDWWILERRGPKPPLDPDTPYATAWEEEVDASGDLASTAVVFLTNRECPFRCAMCDLWMHTLDVSVAPGAIPRQIRQALDGLPAARQIKLYNAGSFFDPRAIPVADDAAIATLVSAFDRVVVEAHPAFLDGVHGDRCLRLRDRLHGRLEVAIGLETAHADTLERLNKRMTLGDFRRAADFLRREAIDLRAFVLLRPPFLAPEPALEWACRSVDVAAECGAAVCSVIPTRGGNGAMEAIAAEAGAALRRETPWLADLERVVEHGLTITRATATPSARLNAAPAASGAGRMRVFADLWDVERFFECECSAARADRLREMNRSQLVPARVSGTGACACDPRV